MRQPPREPAEPPAHARRPVAWAGGRVVQTPRHSHSHDRPFTRGAAVAWARGRPDAQTRRTQKNTAPPQPSTGPILESQASDEARTSTDWRSLRGAMHMLWRSGSHMLNSSDGFELPTINEWSVERSKALYNCSGWGSPYFTVNEEGHLVVRPAGERRGGFS
jgi:hypothetical protein